MSDKFDVPAILASTDLVQLVNRYVELKPKGHEYIGRCVWHAPDNNPSMTVNIEKGLVFCFSCEQGGTAIDFLMQVENLTFIKACAKLMGAELPPEKPLTKAELKKPPERKTFAPPVGIAAPNMKAKNGSQLLWTKEYKTADGNLLGYVARYDNAKDKYRYFTWGQRTEADPVGWECGQFSRPRPLYGLDKIAKNPDAQIIVVEGEKACDAATLLFPDKVCVTWPGGVNGRTMIDWTPIIGREKPILLIPDADVPGTEAMDWIAAMLYTEGAEVVKQIDTSTIIENGVMIESPKGWDLADIDWTPDMALEWARDRIKVYAKTKYIKQPSPRKNSLGVVDASGAVRLPKFKPVEAEEELPPEYSEDALSDQFSKNCGVDWRSTPEWNAWHKWTGSFWKENKTNLVYNEGKELLRAIALSASADVNTNGKQRLTSKKTLWNVIDMASFDPRHATGADEWDGNNYLLGTPSGTVDLKSGVVMDAQRGFMITKATAVIPVIDDCPLWMSVIERASAGDVGFAAYLQRWAGYMLTGDIKEECFMFIYGPGGSGKSTFISVLQAILGDYAKTASMEALTTGTKNDNTELADHAGARLVVANETADGMRFNEQKLTQLTGRDKVRARQVYQKGFEYAVTYKICVVGNNKPTLRSVGEEIRRRLHLVSFPTTIPESERDNTLKDRLVLEYPAILQWMIEGCLEWQRIGLGKPEQVVQATSDYLREEDILGGWMDDCCDVSPNGKAVILEAYNSYKKWAESNGEYCPSQKRFSAQLNKRGFAIIRVGIKMFSGFSLRLSELSGGDYHR